MSLLYPLGLLGLLAIPVLIIIYIIKSKYTEQVIASTYLWELSEKFLKKRRRISRFAGLISLLLQIFAVILISVAIAHPVFVIPGAANDYCFILDASGSMNIVSNGKMRFDAGKDEIRSVISGSAEGSAYTLICSGDTNDVIFENETDKGRALKLLSETKPAYINSVMNDALATAQAYFDENPSIKTYLITDKAYQSISNLELVNVSSGEVNYALSEVEYPQVLGNRLTVKGKAVSYESDAEVDIKLFVDGVEVSAKLFVGGTEQSAQKLSLKDKEILEFSLEYTYIPPADATEENRIFSYESLKVEIPQKDALDLDNRVIIYNEKSDESFNTLIVSDSSTFYLESALLALGNNSLTTVKTKEYTSLTSGYGLYIFDGFAPETLPADGAVWFINPDKTTADSGFNVQPTPVDRVGALKLSTSKNPAIRDNLLKGMFDADGNQRDEILVSSYNKCVLYGKFNRLATLDDNPVIFAGSNSKGNREVVFAFDLQKSDIAMSMYFTVLVNNLLNFTFPQIIDTPVYYCGETLQIHVPANCRGIEVCSPNSPDLPEPLDAETDLCEYELKEVGVYTVRLSFGSGIVRTVHVFSEMPEEERRPVTTATGALIVGEPQNEKRDGSYSDLLILFIVLAVVFIADWMVYCYEQYQLR